MNALSQRRPRWRHPEDGGYTLTEFIVAMGIFTIFLAMFGSGVVIMTRDTVRTQVTVDTTAEGRRAYSALDKQVRNAAAINPVVLRGGRYYVEFRTDTTGAGGGVKNPPLCTQWRLDTATDTLQQRTWTEGHSGSTLTGWSTRAQGITNSVGDPPFAFRPVDGSSTRQRLEISWEMDAGPNAPTQHVEGTLVARNSNADTTTNASPNRICTDQGQP